jgi:hypothetical protein
VERSTLLLKKRELAAQIEELKRKMLSIDDVLSLFPTDDDTPPLKGMGKYVHKGPTEAILDACSAVSPMPLTVANLADILEKEGLQSKASNLRTTIAGIADRLVDKGRLSRGTKGGTKAYYVPEATDKTEEGR